MNYFLSILEATDIKYDKTDGKYTFNENDLIQIMDYSYTMGMEKAWEVTLFDTQMRLKGEREQHGKFSISPKPLQ